MALYNGLYFYPPRTESKIPYTESPVMSMWRGYTDSVAQYKLNGNRNLVKVSPEGTVEFWNRHNEKQKYVIPAPIRDFFLGISLPGKWTVWDSELLHTKTKNVKDVVYVFDCLVWDSQHLIGKTYEERHRIVRERIPSIMSFIRPVTGVYSAENIPVAYWDIAWETAKAFDFVEGLVLKRSGGILEFGSAKVNNSGFMCRVRKPHKNAMF